MGVISYYLATSLDGYLARENGAVDWLDPYQFPLGTPFDYERYYETVSAVIMGRKTWEVAKSFEERPYSDRQTLVVSSGLRDSDLPDYAKALNQIDEEFFTRLRAERDGRIWIVGGSQIASRLLELNLVDEIVQTIIPVTLGSGIPWLLPNRTSALWSLKGCYQCDRSVIQLVYEKAESCN